MLSKAVSPSGFLFSLGAALGVIAASLFSERVLADADAGRKLPVNVLFVAIDDLRCEMGCWGHSYMVTPNLDRLAARGTRFTRAYCQQALCHPSRNSVISGLRPTELRKHDRSSYYRAARPDLVSLPQLFLNHGYYTRSLGKIMHHNGAGPDRTKPQYDPVSWSAPMYWPVEGMYVKRPEILSRSQLERRTSGIPKDNKPLTEIADVDDDAYRDGKVAAETVRTLRRIKDRPFFLAAGFFKPHTPFNAPRKYWEMYDPAQIQLASNPFPTKDVPGMAMYNWDYIRSFCDSPDEGQMPDDQARHLLHAYYASISYMDAQLGRILDELDRLDLTERTIILAWSDHGYCMGEHGIWGKHTNFEDATLTPMMICVPGQANAGEPCEALVELVDMYPTLAELCDLPVPEHVEGTSFVPLIDSPNRTWKAAAFSEYPRGGALGTSMRTRRYRYTEWCRGPRSEVVARELYDHEADPQENSNVADSPAHSETVARLSRQLRAGWRGALPPVAQ